MSKFRITFSASAFIGVVLAVEAKDEDDAEQIGLDLLASQDFTDELEGFSELFAVDEHALGGYLDQRAKDRADLPPAIKLVKTIDVQLDDGGFEVLDTTEEEPSDQPEIDTTPPWPTTEQTLRAAWDEKGVPKEEQDAILASIAEKAKAGAKVGPFTIPQPEDF